MLRLSFLFAATLVLLSAQTQPAVAVSPNTGAGAEASITVSVNRSGELERLSSIRVLIHQQLNGSDACFLQHNAGSSTIALRNNTNTAWQEAVALAGPINTANAQCRLVASASSVYASGAVYNLVLKLQFEPAFSGRRLIWVQAVDDAGMASGAWQYLGEWVVPTSTATGSDCIRVDGTSGPCLAKFRIDRFRVTAPVPSFFTLAYMPMPGADPKVYRNGLLLMPGDDYTLSARQLTFHVPIVLSDIVQAEYWIQ